MVSSKENRSGWHRERPAKSIIFNGDANVKDCYIRVELSSPNTQESRSPKPGQAADNAHRVAQAGFPVYPCREKLNLDKLAKAVRGTKAPLIQRPKEKGRPGHAGRPRNFLGRRLARWSLSDHSLMQALQPVILPNEPRAQAGNPSCKRR